MNERSLGLGARATAEKVYDWEVIGAEMMPLYHACLDDAGAASV